MTTDNDLDSYSRMMEWEAKTKYENERRKTELALAKVESKKNRRINFVNRMTHVDTLIAFAIPLVILGIVGAIVYGVTRPVTEAEIQHKKEQMVACYDAGRVWDDYGSGTCEEE